MTYFFSKAYSKTSLVVLAIFLPIGLIISKQVVWAKLGLEGGSIDSRWEEYAPLLTIVGMLIFLHSAYRYFVKGAAVVLLDTGILLRNYYGLKKFIEWKNIVAISIVSDQENVN